MTDQEILSKLVDLAETGSDATPFVQEAMVRGLSLPAGRFTIGKALVLEEEWAGSCFCGAHHLDSDLPWVTLPDTAHLRARCGHFIRLDVKTLSKHRKLTVTWLDLSTNSATVRW